MTHYQKHNNIVHIDCRISNCKNVDGWYFFDMIIPVFLFGLSLFFLLLAIIGCSKGKEKHYSSKNAVTARFSDANTGRTIHSGHGHSIGEALVDGFGKMYLSVSTASRAETIQSKLDTMRKALADNKGFISSAHANSCQSYIDKMQDLLREKQDQQSAADIRREFAAKQRALVTPSMRYDIMNRDKFRCVLCGATQADGVKLHVDHIIPVSKGGKTEPSNLRTLCDRCNLGKGSKIESSTYISQIEDKSFWGTVSNPTSEPNSKPVYFTSLDSLKRRLDTISGLNYKQFSTFKLEINSTKKNDQFLNSIVVVGYKKTCSVSEMGQKWIFEREL